MQALLFLAIFGVIAVFGVGFLSNDVELWIQEFGVGEGIVESPVEGTELSILIERVQTQNGFDDFITTCEFTSIDTDLLPGTKLYCKLYDDPVLDDGYIIATGFVELVNPVPMGTVIPIIVDQFSFDGSNNVNFVANVLVEVQNPSQ